MTQSAIKDKNHKIIPKNIILTKLKENTLQSIYGLQKQGLYTGRLKQSLDNMLNTLSDFDV